MDALPLPAEPLLASCGLVALQADNTRQLLAVHNTGLLAAWLPPDARAEPGDSLAGLLSQLLDAAQVDALLQCCQRVHEPGAITSAPVLSAVPGRLQRLAAQRCFDIWALPLHNDTTQQVLLLLADVSARQAAALALDEARASAELAVTVLRTEPAKLRIFLQSAHAAVGKIRSTLKMPTRTQDALREKLARLQAEAQSLQSGAAQLDLQAIATASQALMDILLALAARGALSGDELLPLAPRIDAIASAIGAASRLDEQRPAPSPPSPRAARSSTRTTTRKTLAWHEGSERHWSEFLANRGEEIGKLARLKMNGAQAVPASLRRNVDEILEPLLRNALEHGIETPEKRLGENKPAAGQISVSFESRGADGLEMTVHDDGNGFDLERIGRAAVSSGLLTEDTLAATEPGALVGLIFKPSCTTGGHNDNDGHGRGMASVRTTVTRLGGRITVATKPRRYTLFTVRLPAKPGRSADR